MAPRPFPFPLSTGVDVCYVNRIAGILRRDETRDRWIQKVFTRLEWPEMCDRIEAANVGVSYKEYKDTKDDLEGGNSKSGAWELPNLNNHVTTLSENKLFTAAISDFRSNLGRLARFFSGR